MHIDVAVVPITQFFSLKIGHTIIGRFSGGLYQVDTVGVVMHISLDR